MNLQSSTDYRKTDMHVNPNQKKLHALIVEDDESIRQLMKLYLRNFSTVDEAMDAFEAYELLSSQSYDFVLMDIQLGGHETGVDITRKIRSSDHMNSLPVIAVTAIQAESFENHCIESGVTAYLRKPFLKNDLISLIKTTISHTKNGYI